jgi:hypothetical protein
VSEPPRLMLAPPGEARRLSNSEMQSFKACRRQWDLRWRRQLTRDREASTGPLALGTKVHLALASMYSPTDPGDPVAVLRQAYDAELEAYPSEEEGLLKDRALALCMVEGYVQWVEETGADDWFEVLGEEVPFEVELVPGVHLVGRLDLVVRRRSDGALACLDHKTTASLSVPLKTIHLNEQGRLYAMLLRLAYPGSPVAGAVWSWLLKSKRTARSAPPYYAREELWYTDRELRSFHTRLAGQAREILRVQAELDSGADPLYVAYPSPSDTCSWKCDYLAVCPLFDDGSHVDGVLEASYVKHDPYDRYFEERDPRPGTAGEGP